MVLTSVELAQVNQEKNGREAPLTNQQVEPTPKVSGGEFVPDVQVAFKAFAELFNGSRVND